MYSYCNFRHFKNDLHKKGNSTAKKKKDKTKQNKTKQNKKKKNKKKKNKKTHKEVKLYIHQKRNQPRKSQAKAAKPVAVAKVAEAGEQEEKRKKKKKKKGGVKKKRKRKRKEEDKKRKESNASYIFKVF